jgi:hypothetical protein
MIRERTSCYEFGLLRSLKYYGQSFINLHQKKYSFGPNYKNKTQDFIKQIQKIVIIDP